MFCASTGICPLGHLPASIISALPTLGFSALGGSFIFVSPPSFPSAFRPIPPNPTQACLMSFLSTTARPWKPSRVSHSSAHLEAPPLLVLPTQDSTQQPRPSLSGLFPTITIHPGSFHQLRPFSSKRAPFSAARSVTIPIAQMRMARLG